jgi:poly(hydroxyalkanoate) depolymerase family esterase
MRIASSTWVRAVLAGLLASVTLVGVAPATAAARPALTTHSYTNAAGTREYQLFLPDRPGPLPLVVYLHGCGAPVGFGYGWEQLAEARGFAVAYPLQSAAANPDRCWNWTQAQHQHRDAGEPSLIAGITREVAQQHAIDARRIFITGHSAGSGMTAILSAAYPDLYAAAALIAGCGDLTCRDVTGLTAYLEMGRRARPLPAYLVWGSADQTNPYATGRLQLLQWLGMNDFADDGLPNLSIPRLPTAVGGGPGYTIEHYRDRRGCGPVDFATITGGGHIPDFRSAPALPGITDFLLAHPLRPEC